MPTMPIETATTAPSLSGPGIASDENMPENDLVANTPVEEVPVLSSEIDAPDDSDATLDVTIRSKNQTGDEDGILGDHPPPLATSGDDIGTTARSTFSTTEHTTTTSTSEPSQGFALEFEDICLTAQTSRWKRANNSNSKAILHGLTGHIPAGKVTALMGGSGSGKSSLIKILTGRIGNHSKNTEMSGRILLDGNVVDPTNIAVKRNIAYVEQDVSIPATCTPREAIFFSARLRLDQKLNDPDIDQLVDNMLEKLNLRKSANTIMGGGTTLGSRLSGGEQKRVQCGIELVTQPIILVCDEPLTGLDSYSAEMLVDILKRTGATILLSIHQPSPLIVRKLDHLILLQSGRLVFDGAMNHSLSEFFARKGFAKPDDYNISDWIMDVLQSHSTAQLKEAGFFEKDSIGVGEEFTPRFPKDVQLPPVVPFHGIQHAGWMTQCRLLFSRELCQLIRDRGAFMIRIGTTIFFGLLYGLIYFDIGKEDLSNQINVSSTFGAIAVFLVTTISGVAQSSLMDFPRDRRTFLREYSTNHYSALPYFFAHLCFEVVLTVFQTFLQVLVSYFLMDLRMNFFLFWSINFVLALGVTSFGVLLGSIVENPNVAIQLMPALVVPQMLFSGFFISTDLIPSFLRWIQYLCALTYAMRLALFYEFQECDYETCVETLERNGVLELDTIWYWTILLAITVCFRTVSMIALRQKADFG